MSRSTAWFASVALATTLSVGPAGAEEKPIRIGFAIAQSGWLSNWDLPTYRTAVMKIEEINGSGGLLGRQIEYTVADTRTDQALAASSGQKLVASGIDLLVVSNDYDFGAPAALAANQAGIIAFSLTAGDPKMGVQGVGPYTFSGGTAAQAEGIAIAEYGQKQLGLKTVYVLEDTLIEYNKSACAGFRAGWLAGADSSSILGEDTFLNEDPSIAAQITRIRNLPTPPDAIFMCSLPPGGASATRQIRAAGLDMPILASNGMADNYWLDAVPGLKDFYLVARMSLYGDDPRPMVRGFLEAYQARYGELPESSQAFLGYNAIEQWAYAVEEAGSTEAAKVVAVMNTFKDQEFTAGPTTYTDELHIQVDNPFLVMKVEDGSSRAVELFRASFKPDMQILFRR